MEQHNGGPSQQLAPGDVDDEGEEPRAAAGWWKRNRPEVIRDVTIAVLVLVAGFAWDARMAARSEQAADRLAHNAEMLENTRYVRSLSSRHDVPRVFNGIDLRGANLSGLDLSCKNPPADFIDPDQVGAIDRQHLADCADLTGADLRNASLDATNLGGALLLAADLSGAELRFASFASATLIGAHLDGANLEHADFTDADLNSVRLQGAALEGTVFTDAKLWLMNLRGVDLSLVVGLEKADFGGMTCYDENTRWPDGFEPPALNPVCPEP